MDFNFYCTPDPAATPSPSGRPSPRLALVMGEIG